MYVLLLYLFVDIHPTGMPSVPLSFLISSAREKTFVNCLFHLAYVLESALTSRPRSTSSDRFIFTMNWITGSLFKLLSLIFSRHFFVLPSGQHVMCDLSWYILEAGTRIRQNFSSSQQVAPCLTESGSHRFELCLKYLIKTPLSTKTPIFHFSAFTFHFFSPLYI